MAKIKIDLDASDIITVTREVSIPTASGKPLKIKFDFKHRDRVAMNEFQDENAARAKVVIERVRGEIAEKERDGDGRLGQSFVLEAIKRDADAIMEIATGWNVDAEFNADNLQKLCRGYPGAAAAIVNDYRVTMNEGRLGN